MPYSDNALFLIGVQSFVKYGITVSMSVYRPAGMMWSAFLFKLGGESMMTFFYFQALLSSIGIFGVAVLLRRFLSWPLVLLFTWFISTYTGKLQGTFLTELTSMPFALLSLSMLLYGWTERRTGIMLIGVSLLAVAFEMRPAVFFFPPLLFILLGWSYRHHTRFAWRPFIMAASIYALTVLGNRMIIRMLEYPPPAISNTFGKLYQIYIGSDEWNAVNNLNPPTPLKKAHQLDLFRQEYVHRLILQDPMPLFRNYMSRLSNSFTQPQKLFEVIDPMISKGKSIILLILLAVGIVIHRGSRNMMFMHGLCVCYLLAAVFSFPFLHAEFRVMSVTQSFVILSFLLAINNGWLMVKGLISSILNVFIQHKPDQWWNILTESQWYERPDLNLNSITFLSVIILGVVLVTPLILDNTRAPIRSSLHRSKQYRPSKTDSSLVFFLLDVQHTPRAQYVPQEIQPVTPTRMSLQRIQEKWMLDSSLQGGFYLFNAINHDRFTKRRSYSPNLVIPTGVANRLDLDHLGLLMLEGRFKILSKNGYVVRMFLTERILSMSPARK